MSTPSLDLSAALTLADLANLSNVVMGLCTIALTIFACRGLNTWEDQLRADAVLERRRVARKLHSAIHETMLNILSMRKGKITAYETRKGVLTYHATGAYMAQAPTFYLTMVMENMRSVWDAFDEGRLTLPADTLEKLGSFGTAVKVFQDAFTQYHFSSIVMAPILLGEDHALALELEKINFIHRAPKDGEDPFAKRLEDAAAPLVNSLGLIIQGRDAP